MEQKNIQKIQERFVQWQKGFTETIELIDGKIKVIFNGNLQINKMEIADNIEGPVLQTLLMETFNAGIKHVSEKVQKENNLSAQ